jgi:hypothetical protein
LFGLILLIVIASFFVDEPLRRGIERGMNANLKGYKVTLPHAHFRLFDLSVTLRDLTVRQEAHPEPPVAVIPRLHAHVQWGEVVRLKLVADFLFEHPKIYLNLPQLETEIHNAVPVNRRGWQQALEKVYPLKINLLRIDDAEVTYIDQDPQKPLRITHLFARANNIRNIHSREHVYPSPIRAEATVFESGRASIEGHADFLAEPSPGFHVMIKASQIPLEKVAPVAARANLSLRGGVIDTDGEVELSPKTKYARLAHLTIRGLRADYIHTAETAPAEAERKEKVKTAARKAANQPGLTLKVDQFALENGEFGWINRAKTPPYRVFLSAASLKVSNLSNHFEEGPAQARVEGKFMGGGRAVATAVFRPDKKGPDFDLKVAIEGTPAVALNNVFQAYGKFDVAQGEFSFYSELHVHNGQVEGYVKPLFENMKVYDARQDAEKSLFRKLYEKLVGGVAGLLKNRNTDKVATATTISGPAGNATTSTWQVITRLIENAFFRAILPGFDEAIAARRKR